MTRRVMVRTSHDVIRQNEVQSQLRKLRLELFLIGDGDLGGPEGRGEVA